MRLRLARKVLYLPRGWVRLPRSTYLRGRKRWMTYFRRWKRTNPGPFVVSWGGRLKRAPCWINLPAAPPSEPGASRPR